MTDPVADLRAMLPGAVGVAGGQIADLAGTDWPGEDTARFAPPRRADFTAGRAAARAALVALGHPPATIPRDPRGPAIWPAGLTGSITHGAGWALAAICRQSSFRSIGIDIEATGADLPLPEIASADEIARLADADPTWLFSAKEALYKALFPLTGVMLGFHDIDLTLRPGGFLGRLTVAAPPFGPGWAFAGLQRSGGGILLSAALIPAPGTPPIFDKETVSSRYSPCS